MEPTRTPESALSPADDAEFDTPAEVDALFRTQRRIAVGYFAVFLAVTLGVPALTLVVDWWSQGRLVGGMSPAFVMAAVGLYAFFGFLAVAVGALATAVEDRMLGDQTPQDDGYGEGGFGERGFGEGRFGDDDPARGPLDALGSSDEAGRG